MKKSELIFTSLIISLVFLSCATSRNPQEKNPAPVYLYTDKDIKDKTSKGINIYEFASFNPIQNQEDGSYKEAAVFVGTTESIMKRKYFPYTVSFCIISRDSNGKPASPNVERACFVHDKSEAKKVFEEMKAHANSNLTGDGFQYYGYDYNVNFLMSNRPLRRRIEYSYGRYYTDADVLYEGIDSKGFLVKIYEDKYLESEYLPDGSHKHYYLSVFSQNNKSYPYVVVYGIITRDSNGREFTDMRSVNCRTKAQAHIVARKIVHNYKKDIAPGKVTQTYRKDYDFDTLMK